MNFRPPRGSLKAAMRECVFLPSTIFALAKHLNESESDIVVKPYSGADDRIGWSNTYLVLVSNSPVGFTDEQV